MKRRKEIANSQNDTLYQEDDTEGLLGCESSNESDVAISKEKKIMHWMKKLKDLKKNMKSYQ